jgi:hypothetical protein
LLRLDQRIRNDIDRERSIELPRAAKTAGLHEVCAVAALAIGGDDDLFERRWSISGCGQRDTAGPRRGNAAAPAQDCEPSKRG